MAQRGTKVGKSDLICIQAEDTLKSRVCEEIDNGDTASGNGAADRDGAGKSEDSEKSEKSEKAEKSG